MLSDEMLVAESLSGEISAFEELVNRYKNQVFAIIYRMTGQYQEAEDISQEVFLLVYQKLYQFDPAKKFSPWLYRIAVNTCISSLRKKKKVVSINFEENLISYKQIDYSHDNSPDTILENKELRQEIQHAISQLNENYRLVIILRYQMDFSNQEIAEIIGTSRENVDVKLHRARKALRKILLQNLGERGKVNELPAN